MTNTTGKLYCEIFSSGRVCRILLRDRRMHCFPRFQLKSCACRMAIKWNSSLLWRVYSNVRSARVRVHCAQLRSGCFRSKDRAEVTSNDLFSLASNRNVRWLGSWHDEASQQLLTNGSPSTEEINCFIDDNALAYRWTRLFREKRSNTLASPFPRRIHPLEYSNLRDAYNYFIFYPRVVHVGILSALYSAQRPRSNSHSSQ